MLRWPAEIILRQASRCKNLGTRETRVHGFHCELSLLHAICDGRKEIWISYGYSLRLTPFSAKASSGYVAYNYDLMTFLEFHHPAGLVARSQQLELTNCLYLVGYYKSDMLQSLRTVRSLGFVEASCIFPPKLSFPVLHLMTIQRLQPLTLVTIRFDGVDHTGKEYL